MEPQTATSTEPAQEGHQEVVVRCPATGERVGVVPVTPRPQIEAAAARLRAAQPAWQAMGTEGRAEWLGKWRDWLLDHEDELLNLMQRESVSRGETWRWKFPSRRCLSTTGLRMGRSSMMDDLCWIPCGFTAS